MKRILISMCLLAGAAQAAVTITESTVVTLLRGSSTQGSFASWEACRDRAIALAQADTRTSGTVTYACQAEKRQVVAAYSASPSPCGPQPAAETQTVQCPSGTTGSWTQTRSYTSAPSPTCWTAGAWTPASAPTGTCTAVPPPPPPPVVGAYPPELSSFAETWDRNWNFGGHVVDSRFTSAYGNWDYTETTYEPWLFDRASVGYYLYEATGNNRWRQKFLSDFAYYRARIDALGIFTPKGSGDTKYSYVTPFVLYERLTGDAQYRPVARRIHDAWIREFPNTYSPTMAMWTERELGFALEAAVAWYDLTREPAALTRANALVAQWTTMANANGGAPQVSYTQHEGGGPGGTTPSNLTNSPWMSALYFQAARRLHELTGNTEVLQQASRYFDWLDFNGLYDGALVSSQYAGLTFPRYLTGELIGDAGYDEGNMSHALDVAGLVKFAVYAKGLRGENSAQASTRLAELQVTMARDFSNWTRSTTYLPKYRLTPPRKFNWWVRGARELAR
jgi:hypothetical protein